MENVGFNIFNRNNVENKPMSGFSIPFEVFTFKPDFTTVGNYISDKKVIWNFGDNTTSTELTAKHYYKYPGNYPVTLTVFNSSGISTNSTYTSAINIYNYVNDGLLITSTKTPIQVSGQNNNPFILTRYNSYQTSVTSNVHLVNLSVSGNRSPFYNAEKYYKDKNIQFYSTSRFVVYDNELGETVIDKLSTTNDKLYAYPSGNTITLTTSAGIPGSYFIGTSGYAVFYYVEDFS